MGSGPERTHQDAAKPSYPEHVGDFDAVLWNIEKDPQLRNTIAAVFVLDRNPDRTHMFERQEHVSRTIPGFRHRLVTPPLRLATPRWVVDQDFDPSYHLRFIAAPEPRTIDTVLDYARQSMMSGLDKDRPLWTFTVVEGLEGGQAAVIIKLHHVLTDGVGGLGMLPLVVDLTPEQRDLGPLPPVPEGEAMTRGALARDALGTSTRRVTGFVRDKGGAAVRNAPGAVRHPIGTAKTAVRNVQALGRILTPATKTLSPIMRDRRGWARFATLEIDLAALRGAAKSHGATLNDAFVTAVANGFARYHEQHGAPVEQLRATVVVNTRGPDDPPYGNHVSGGSFVMNVGTDDVAAYMAQYHDLIARARDDVRQPLANAMGPVLNGFGPLVSGVMGSILKHSDFVTSNIAGIDVPLYMGGAEIAAMYGFGPGMGTPANITLLSYRGTAFIGLNIDAGAVPDVEVLVDCVHQGFDTVLALAAG